MTDFPENLVERVARAICTVLFENPEIYWDDAPVPDGVDKYWRDYTPEARAALVELAKSHDVVERVDGSKTPETAANDACVSSDGINLAVGQVWTHDCGMHTEWRITYISPLPGIHFVDQHGSPGNVSQGGFLAWIKRTGARLVEVGE